MDENEKTSLPINAESPRLPNTQLQNIKAAVKWLSETFPGVFDNRNPMPLKVGIWKDIAAQLPIDTPFSKVILRGALRLYTNSTPYHKAVISNDVRYDLGGNAAGEVTQKEKEYSHEALSLRLKAKGDDLKTPEAE